MGLAAAQAAVVSFETMLRQCAYQTALVDSAEIEGAYENTIKLIGLNTKVYEKQLEDNLLKCNKVVGLILPEPDGQAEWVADLIQTRIIQFDDAIGDTDRVNNAQQQLDRGNNLFFQGQYERAYDKYCRAYAALVCSGDDDDDCDDDD